MRFESFSRFRSSMKRTAWSANDVGGQFAVSNAKTTLIMRVMSANWLLIVEVKWVKSKTRHLTCKPKIVNDIILSQVAIKNFVSPHPMYACLLPLRCLMLEENNPEKWINLMELQSHHGNAKNNDQAKAALEGVGKFIPRYKSFFDLVKEGNLKLMPLLRDNCNFCLIYYIAKMLTT